MKQEKIKGIMSQFSRPKILLILGFAGMILIGLSSFGGDGGNEAVVPGETETTAQYEEKLEEKLQKLVESLCPGGECTVTVTLEQGAEYVYAKEDKNSVDVSEENQNGNFSTGNRTSDEQTYIMVTTNNGEQPLLLTQLAPKVQGVVVVCKGQQAVSAQTIQNALSTALQIEGDRIFVVTSTKS